MKQIERIKEDSGLSRLKKRMNVILQYVKNNPNWRE